MTITTDVDVTISQEDIAAEVRRWSDADKRQFLIDVGVGTVPFSMPTREELAATVEPFLPDSATKPAKWLADDIAMAILKGAP